MVKMMPGALGFSPPTTLALTFGTFFGHFALEKALVKLSPSDSSSELSLQRPPDMQLQKDYNHLRRISKWHSDSDHPFVVQTLYGD